MTDLEIPKPQATDVFSDLGFPLAEAENLRIRSALMRDHSSYVRKNKLTQVRAAKLLSAIQPRVSGLLCGKIHLCSIDNLVNLLVAAGLRVEMHAKKFG